MYVFICIYKVNLMYSFLVDCFRKNLGTHLSVPSAYVKKQKEKYIYMIYIRRKNTELYTHTHTHTQVVPHVSAACHHRTLSNIQIIRTIKPYLPITSQRMLVSLHSFTLMIDSLRSFTLTMYVNQCARRTISENLNRQQLRCDNLKCHIRAQ